jgi:hypothetical protein
MYYDTQHGEGKECDTWLIFRMKAIEVHGRHHIWQHNIVTATIGLFNKYHQKKIYKKYLEQFAVCGITCRIWACSSVVGHVNGATAHMFLLLMVCHVLFLMFLFFLVSCAFRIRRRLLITYKLSY